MTLVLVAIMAAAVAWSLDDAAWVIGVDAWGDFYVPAAVIAALVAFAGAKARWPRLIVHLFGATVPALVLPVVVGALLRPDAGSPLAMFQVTAAASVRALADLSVGPLTRETGHHLLAIGLLAWSVGQFAAYRVFAYRKPGDAVAVAGIVLVGNIALATAEHRGSHHLLSLVLFSVAALALLARGHATEEHDRWVRRRVGDAPAVRSMYLRGASLFIAAAIASAFALTVTASTAPLGGAPAVIGSVLSDLGQRLHGLLPRGVGGLGIGSGFSDRAVIGDRWLPQDVPSAEIALPRGERDELYWRVVAYDRFEFPNVWSWSDAHELDRPRDAPILAGTADDPAGLGARRELAFTVTPASRSAYAISAQDPVRVGQDTRLAGVGDRHAFAAVLLSDPGAAYTVVAAIPVFGERVAGGITGNRLWLTSEARAYPADIRTRYIDQVPDRVVGPQAAALLAEIRARAGSDNPYDLAVAAEAHLRTRGSYDADIADLAGCADLGVVECFATFRRGFCRQFAATMAILLREAGVPARVVEGYLPVAPTRAGIVRVTSNQAHAWVEVWFPQFGWIRFDPSPRAAGMPSNIPAGSPLPSAVRPSIDPSFRLATDRPSSSGAAGTTDPSPADPRAGGPELVATIAMLLVVAVAGAAVVIRHRRPRSASTPDSVWRGLALTASRLGLGPRQSQTAYEYAGRLVEVLPASRSDIETVATANVEATYGRRSPDAERMREVHGAGVRVRRQLIRSTIRRLGARRLFRRFTWPGRGPGKTPRQTPGKTPDS